MRSITLSIRTYSDIDIDVYGAYKHIYDDSFEIMLIAYAIDDNPVKIVDLSKNDQIPSELHMALLDNYVCKYTLDSVYERGAIEKAIYDTKKVLQKNWISIFSVLKCFSIPKDLEDIATLYDMKKAKCDYIHKYDSFFSKPMCAADIKKRVMPEEYPVIWQHIKDYLKWQVEIMRDIANKTYGYCLYHRMNIFKWMKEYELMNNIISDRYIHINAAKLRNMMLEDKYRFEGNHIYLRLDKLNRYNNVGGGSNTRVDILKQVVIPDKNEKIILFNFEFFKDYILGWMVGEVFSNETTSPATVSYVCERISRAIEYVVEFKQEIIIGRTKIYWRDGSVWIKVNNKVRLVYVNLTINRIGEQIGFTYVSKGDCYLNKYTTSCERIYTDIISAIIKDLIYMVARQLTMNKYVVYCISEEKLLLSCPGNAIDNMQDIVNYTCMKYLE